MQEDNMSPRPWWYPPLKPSWTESLNKCEGCGKTWVGIISCTCTDCAIKEARKRGE